MKIRNIIAIAFSAFSLVYASDVPNINNQGRSSENHKWLQTLNVFSLTIMQLENVAVSNADKLIINELKRKITLSNLETLRKMEKSQHAIAKSCHARDAKNKRLYSNITKPRRDLKHPVKRIQKDN
jgi:hypothetical protein